MPRLIISNFLKAKQKPGGTTNLQQKKSQARLAPEIVSASQYRKFDEFQTGILIYELLHQPNPFEVRAQLREQDYRQEDLPPLPALSLYSPGLQRLAHLLLEADPIKRIRERPEQSLTAVKDTRLQTQEDIISVMPFRD